MDRTVPSILLRFSMAVLKHQAERILGKDALGLLAETITEVSGENLNEKLETFLAQDQRFQRIRQAFQRADECFAALKPEYRDLQLRLSDLPSLEQKVHLLPAQLDAPDFLLDSLKAILGEYYPNLPADFRRQAAEAYRNCLEEALASVSQEDLLPLLFTRLTRMMNRQEEIYNQLSGKNRYLPTFETAIQNFLTLYLGKPGEPPVPFGGREEELTTLNRWLFSEKSPPYLLLTAPAGRGKSALLVRWVAALTKQQGWQVLFLPISIRAETNLEAVFFKALAVRLGEFYEEDLRQKVEGQTPVEVWRDLCADYLSRPLPDGKRLLVVFDGLDEAAGWNLGINLIPLNPPSGLKILVSARLTATHSTPKEWLSHLDWDRSDSLAQVHELAPISREGVADILRKMGMPLDQLAQRDEILTTLYTLSEGGDPLLLNLYVQDLWKRGEDALRLSVDELKRLKPGYEGYFEKWWQDQRKLWGEDRLYREEVTRFLFDALACAFGPLRVDDLLHLAERSGKIFDSHHIQKGLEDLQRFVFVSGEGKNAGYVFNHPKLAEFFFNQLKSDSEREARGWEERFLGWGDAVLEDMEKGEIRPENAPAYLVQYYTAHLERAKVPLENYLRLIHTPTWMQAWYALEGSYSGFLSDLGRVWTRVEEDNQKYLTGGQLLPCLGEEIRCALIQASLRSLSANLPPELILALVKAQQWHASRALAYIHNTPGDSTRARALADLAPHLPPNLLEQALQAAQTIANPFALASALADLAPHLSRLARQRLYPLWQNALHRLALRTRRDLLSDLLSLTPVIQALGGSAALGEMANAIADVGNWLP